jgi:mannose-1-phosphate guanylyltransferase
MKKTWAVILAGGSGTRFWPRSRQKLPKQCLCLTSDNSLIQETVERLEIPIERVLVITGAPMSKAIAKQLPQLPSDQLLVEPSGRNTLPAIAWAAVEVWRRGGEVMVVLPSDHAIVDVVEFRAVLQLCVAECRKGGDLYLLGQKPEAPDSAFGYLRLAPLPKIIKKRPFHQVRGFVEKPTIERAAALIDEGALVNGGIFVWTVDNLRAAIRRHLPQTAGAMDSMEMGEPLSSVWERFEPTSVDYGILEKSNNLIAVACDFGWRDLGSLTVLGDILPAHELGAASVAEGIAIGGGEHVVWAPKKLVATLGVSNLVVIDTEDVLLIADKDRLGEVKEVLATLQARGHDDYL